MISVEGDEEEVEDIGEGGDKEVDKQIEAIKAKKDLLNLKLDFIEKLLDAYDSDNEGSILRNINFNEKTEDIYLKFMNRILNPKAPEE